jgi:hypothetical protein
LGRLSAQEQAAVMNRFLTSAGGMAERETLADVLVAIAARLERES